MNKGRSSDPSTAVKPKLADVAAAAGVSLTTASEALNGIDGVNSETRQRVVDAAARLRYRPNHSARNLARSSAHTVAIVFSGPPSLGWLSNPIFLELFRPIVSSLNAAGVQAITEIVTVDREIERIEQLGRSGAADVLILLATRRSDQELADAVSRLPIPTIAVARPPVIPGDLSIEVDNWQIGWTAADHLLSLGHRSLGYIGRLPGVEIAERRLEGFLARCAEERVTLRSEAIQDGDFYQLSGAAAMDRLLDSPERPRAVFAANDIMALGAMESCKRRGVQIPNDLALMGADGIPNLELLWAPLTSIEFPLGAMGSGAAELAAAIVKGAKPRDLASRTFTTELVRRASTVG